jgi:50S ribosomal protein L16 3-hydroxylase
MINPVLGTLTSAQFLRRHWQKRPLFIRGAIPDVREIFDADQMRRLACSEDVESRLVTRTRGKWQLEHGPFTRRRLDRPGAKHWSLLVQGVDTQLDTARDLLDRFNFIPYARLDDVMLSLAPPGGGVGPHFDSYDVFLLQVHGTRRWRIGAQRDLTLIDAPLRILKRFVPQEEVVVEPGDLLYLPPRIAHDGIALTDCITCSIGFRAPERQELAAAFLQWLPEALHLEGRYADPGLAPARRPAAIDTAMVRQIGRMLEGVRWNERMLARFLGEYLTEPKPNVWFAPPPSALPAAHFREHARRMGIRLHRKTRMLYRGDTLFINGESLVVPKAVRNEARALADARALAAPTTRSAWWARTLYDWYCAGYVEFTTR